MRSINDILRFMWLYYERFSFIIIIIIIHIGSFLVLRCFIEREYSTSLIHQSVPILSSNQAMANRSTQVQTKPSQATQCNKPKNIKRNKRQSLTDAVAESAMLNRMICQHLNFESSKQTAAWMLKTMPNTDKILSIHIHYALTHSLELG